MGNKEMATKKRVRQKMGNYRPIRLTSEIDNILESVMKDEISEYLEVYGKTRQSQHDVIKGKSCLTTLFEFFEEVMSRLDKGEPIDIIYLDFQKAFDKVLHRRLLSKIAVLGVR
eukprot:g16837.t1